MPCQYSRSNYSLSAKENEVISTEIKKLLKKKVLVHGTTEYNEFISGIFTRNKKDGSKRMVLNLKNFNKFVNYNYFRMESINNGLNIIRPNVYMASIDLKDAFFSVPIHSTHQKYLKFTFNNLFQFTCMPNGYGSAMRVFTKISKVPFEYLRSLGHNSVVYVDDSYLQGDTYQTCLDNISDTIKLLRELGFVIHTEKSVLILSQTIVFLGFIISSKNMTLSLNGEKKNKIKTILTDCLYKYKISLRELARILENIVANFPVVTYGPLHYRHLEREKITGLKYHEGNFEGKIRLSAKAKAEIQWWINNNDNSCQHINIFNPDMTIYTDASLTGRGITDGISSSRGLWHKAELEHLNVLELKAIEIGIYKYCKNKYFLHVSVMCDNVTAISYVNNMGDMKSQTGNNIACRIWDFCTKKHSCGFQRHIYQEQSILRQISNLEYWRMLLSGNSILLFFIKLLKNLENQTQISLLLELISNQIDMCLGIQNQRQWLSMPSLLPGTTIISTCSHF